MKFNDIMNQVKGFFKTLGGDEKSFALANKKNFWFYVAVIILVNIAGLFLFVRGDMTKNSSFSLSKASKIAVENLQDPLIIKVFFSDDLPVPYNGVKTYVEDLIQEYSNAAGSNFKYEIVAVDKGKNKEMAEQYGISPVQITERGSDKYNQRAAFMGIVILHGDLVERINQVTETEGVEYKITSAIQKLTSKVNALGKLKDKATVTLYLSGELESFDIKGVPELKKGFKDVVEKINKENFGKLVSETKDPSKDGNTAEIAAKYGLQQIKWDARGSVKAGSGVVGVVVTIGDKSKSVNFGIGQTIFGGFALTGLDTFEKKLRDSFDFLLSNNPVIGYMTGHNIASLSEEKQAGVFKNINSDMYQFKELDLKTNPVPDEVKTLVVNGPKDALDEVELYNIDQFIMRGGNIVFCIDSFNEIQMNNNPQAMFGNSQPIYMPINTGLDKMLLNFGFTVNKDYIMDKKCYVAHDPRSGEINIYFFPEIDSDNMNDENVITKYLKRIYVPKASSITPNLEYLKNEKIEYTSLLKSSKKAWLQQGKINLTPFMISPPDEKTLSQYTIAVLAEGKFNSIFKDAAPKAILDADKAKGLTTQKTISASVNKSKVFLIGTSDINSANVIDPEGKSPNAAFVHNILDYMNGFSDVPQMRSKGLSFNPIKEKSETYMLAMKIVNIGGLPVIVIVIGLLVMNHRNNRRKKIQKRFSNGGKSE